MSDKEGFFRDIITSHIMGIAILMDYGDDQVRIALGHVVMSWFVSYLGLQGPIAAQAAMNRFCHELQATLHLNIQAMKKETNDAPVPEQNRGNFVPHQRGEGLPGDPGSR